LILASGVGAFGDVQTDSGTLTLGGDLSTIVQAGGNAGAQIRGTGPTGGTLSLGATRNFNVRDSGAATDLDLRQLVIAGAAFGITYAFPGTTSYTGTVSNTYTGTTMVNEGTLVLDRTVAAISIPGALTIGDNVGGPQADVVRYGLNAGGNQIADTISPTVNASGFLDLATNSKSDAITALTLQGGPGFSALVDTTGPTHHRFSRIPSPRRISSRKSGFRAAANRFLAMLSLARWPCNSDSANRRRSPRFSAA
jgi:autotransporter-associated beta strand protein